MGPNVTGRAQDPLVVTRLNTIHAWRTVTHYAFYATKKLKFHHEIFNNDVSYFK